MATGRTTQSDLIDLRDLLDLLRRHPLPTPFKLAIFSEQQGSETLQETIQNLCRGAEQAAPCDTRCLQLWEDTVTEALLTNGPEAHCCPQGFVNFAVPFPAGEGVPDCLLGGGIRDRAALQEQLDSLPRTLQDAPTRALQELRNLPTTTLEEANGIAEEVFRILPRLIDQHLHALSLARTTERLEAVRELCHELSQCNAPGQALGMVSEALVVLFDLPRILILQRQAGQGFTVHTTLGLDPENFELNETRLIEYLDGCDSRTRTLGHEELSPYLPGLKTSSAHLLPLVDGDNRLGLIVLLDVDLHRRDQSLVELLISRLAARLARLRIEAHHSQERTYSTRMVGMISDLSLIDSQEKLLQEILDMSAELLGASTGSLMLLDETGSTLTIAAAKGMSRPLVKTMSVACGEGIAGRVARSGFPLLVNDIERDSRVATRNRPRFKTKSFVSLPLKARDRLVGVLNLADKQDGTSFTEADLNLVHSFTGHAILMIDRAASLERAGHLEQLSVTDPLTGIYNRRFLEARLDEELNRSRRQQQSFCVILADLDNFKLYNDICGHLAGDKALRKAALLMRRSAREMDIVTRYGGEEFCLVLPTTSKKESVFVAERIRRAIDGEGFPGETNLPLGRLTISLGVATYPADGETAAELIHAADLALYRAKDTGRNRVVLYDESLETGRHRRLDASAPD